MSKTLGLQNLKASSEMPQPPIRIELAQFERIWSPLTSAGPDISTQFVSLITSRCISLEDIASIWAMIEIQTFKDLAITIANWYVVSKTAVREAPFAPYFGLYYYALPARTY